VATAPIGGKGRLGRLDQGGDYLTIGRPEVVLGRGFSMAGANQGDGNRVREGYWPNADGGARDG